MQSLPKKSLLPFTEEHEAFRKEFGEFLDREIVPYYMDMEKNHSVGKETFKKFGDAGYGCLWLDKKYGGRELDMLYSIVYGEELSKRGLNGVLTRLSSDTVAPYIYAHGTEAQKEKAQKEKAEPVSYLVIPNRKEAIRYAIEHAQEGDMITILGLGHESYQEENGVKTPHSDIQFAAQCCKECYPQG